MARRAAGAAAAVCAAGVSGGMVCRGERIREDE